MGSKNSHSNSGGKNTQISNQKNNNDQNINNLDVSTQSFDNSIDDTSNYKGITYKNQIQKNDNYNSDQLTQEKTYSDTNSGLFFNIIWKEGGNDVKIAGSFGNWKTTNMKKNFSKKNIIFEKEIPIPNILKEKYQFKFIVDSEWKYSDNYPKIKDDNGNINNYIDNTFINEHSIFVRNKNNETVSYNNETNVKNLLNKSKDNSKDTNKSSYGNIFPNDEQFNQEAPKMPDVLDIFTTLSEYTNQRILGRKIYLKYSPMNLCSSYKSIFPPGHSYMNHLLFNKKSRKKNKALDKEKNSDNISTNFIKINCNIKNKGKCLSILYFYPLND